MRFDGLIAILGCISMVDGSSPCKPAELYCVNAVGTVGLCYIPRDRWDCCDGFLHYMGPGAIDECCYNPILNKTFLANVSSGGCMEFKRTPEPLPIVNTPQPTQASSTASNGLSTGAWIGIICGLVVIFIGAGFYQTKRKKRATSSTDISVLETKEQSTRSKEIVIAE